MKSVLVIEDAADLNQLFCRWLRTSPELTVISALTLADGLRKLPEADCVVLDLGLTGESDGINTYDTICLAAEQADHCIPIVVITGGFTADTIDDIGLAAMSRGAAAFMTKPAISYQLLGAVLRAIDEQVIADEMLETVRVQKEMAATLRLWGEVKATASQIVTQTTEAKDASTSGTTGLGDLGSNDAGPATTGGTATGDQGAQGGSIRAAVGRCRQWWRAYGIGRPANPIGVFPEIGVGAIGLADR